VPEDVKAKVEAKNAALKEAIPSDDVAKAGVSGLASPHTGAAVLREWGVLVLQYSNLPTCCVLIGCPLFIG
jgi:hypothetical protein